MPVLQDFSATTLSGTPHDLDEYAGKVVLVVNTASQCGFTPQYDGLEQLWQDYRDQGLVVLGFPCNQFGGQEPGTAEDIGEFCRVNHGVTFPLFDKVDVNGPDAHPVFAWLSSEARGALRYRRRSSGTSPSSSSVATARSSSRSARAPSPRSSPAPSRRPSRPDRGDVTGEG